jgi:hypothetical protein
MTRRIGTAVAVLMIVATVLVAGNYKGRLGPQVAASAANGSSGSS